MNPVKTIGRYQFPIGNVVMVTRRSGIKGFFKPGYNILLASGIVLHMTEAEKQELDEARGLHEEVIKGLGIVATMQRNNHPVSA